MYLEYVALHSPFPDNSQPGGVGARERTSELRNDWTPMTSGVDLILGRSRTEGPPSGT